MVGGVAGRCWAAAKIGNSGNTQYKVWRDLKGIGLNLRKPTTIGADGGPSSKRQF
jgi:hypothetical protein